MRFHCYLCPSSYTSLNLCLVPFCHGQVANGHEECVEVLLGVHADPTLRDKRGCTPVHFAASCGHASILDALLGSGGGASTPDKKGFTPIHKAAYNGHDKCMDSLMEVRVVAICG